MSTSIGAVGNETHSQPVLNVSPAAPRLGKLVPLSADDWNQHKETLINLYKDAGWSPKALDKWMRGNDHQTS
jgi:hypothetical protein